MLGGGDQRERELGWYLYGSRAYRAGKWKLVWGVTAKRWELYDMEADRTEMHDLAAQNPERVRAMGEQYAAWARRCGVIPREKILELMKAEGGTAFWEEERQP